MLRRSYDVRIGKIDNWEIDFIASNQNEKIYIQVRETMNNDVVKERELKSLLNYKKIVLSLEKLLNNDYEGIEIKSLIGWLLEFWKFSK